LIDRFTALHLRRGRAWRLMNGSYRRWLVCPSPLTVLGGAQTRGLLRLEPAQTRRTLDTGPCPVSVLSLYKHFFYFWVHPNFKALLWESTILSLPQPTCKAYPTLLQYYCKIIAQYTLPHRPPPPPPPPPPPMPYTHNIGDGNIVSVLTTYLRRRGDTPLQAGSL